MLIFESINKFRYIYIYIGTSISNIGCNIVCSHFFFTFFMLMSIPNIDTEYRNGPIRIRVAKGGPQSRPRGAARQLRSRFSYYLKIQFRPCLFRRRVQQQSGAIREYARTRTDGDRGRAYKRSGSPCPSRVKNERVDGFANPIRLSFVRQSNTAARPPRRTEISGTSRPHANVSCNAIISDGACGGLHVQPRRRGGMYRVNNVEGERDGGRIANAAI